MLINAAAYESSCSLSVEPDMILKHPPTDIQGQAGKSSADGASICRFLKGQGMSLKHTQTKQTCPLQMEQASLEFSKNQT
jgi:hypothetical protein